MADYDPNEPGAFTIDADLLPIATPDKTAKRKKLFLALGTAVVAIGGGYAILSDGDHVTTDNAYVNADVAQVTPLVAGPDLR